MDRAGAGPSILLFSRTQGYRHPSIADAIPALEGLGEPLGWSVDATEDPTAFSASNLANYDVVVFLMTTGDVLGAEQEAAFESYMASGGGYVGIHSATDTEYDWVFYGDMLGTYFDGHPVPQTATLTVIDDQHPSTQHLQATWERFDEWYNFAPNPSATVEVLLVLEESSYDGGTMGADHPIAWSREFGGARVFYTGGGHTSESYADADFLQHLRGGIEWAAGGATGGTTTGGSSGDDSGTGTGASTTSSTPTSTSGGGGSTDGGAEAGTDDAGADVGGADEGCTCTSHRRSDGSLCLIVLVGLLVGRRRRDATPTAR